MTDAPPPERRRTFDTAASTYHAARPQYPEALFDRLMELVPSTPRVVEIGPGTGQATEPMLRRGAKVRAIEIGERLAAELASRLAADIEAGRLTVEVADFETVEPDARGADVVLCATAYHWISAGEQLTRPQRWLDAAGRLAVIDTMQVASDVDGGYFDAVNPIYERFGQASGGPSHQPGTVTSPIHDRMVADATYAKVTIDRYRWDQTYTATTYRALLNSYSGVLAMHQPARTEMVDQLVQLVDDMGGQLTRPLVITLATCQFTN